MATLQQRLIHVPPCPPSTSSVQCHTHNMRFGVSHARLTVLAAVVPHTFSLLRASKQHCRRSLVLHATPLSVAMDLVRSVDGAVISASAQASFKLLFVCGVVAWMSHKGKLPPTTPQVLSQVSYLLTNGVTHWMKIKHHGHARVACVRVPLVAQLNGEHNTSFPTLDFIMSQMQRLC